MLVTRVSPITGITNSWEIAVSEQQMADWQSGTLIQLVMPNLSADEREFIMTGITPSEWDEIFDEVVQE